MCVCMKRELYLKRRDVFPFEKYVNRLKEAYNNLEEIKKTKFEEQKVRTLLDHIMWPYDQVKACVHTARKYFKVYFSGSCTYLESEIALIFPEKDPGSQQYRNYGRDMSNKRGNKIHVPEAALGGHQHKKVRKENGVDISNNSRYYSPDEWSKLSSAP